MGITAARLVDATGLPTLVVGLEGELGHGSGRAPEGFPLYDALARCASHLERFGGHHAAVGLTVRAEQVPALREAFSEACSALTPSERPTVARMVDARVGAGPEKLPRASELSQLEPLGEGNPEPVFEIEAARVRGANTVGEGHLKLQLEVGGQSLSAFGYGLGGGSLPAPGSTLRVWGSLRPDTWRGGEAIELRVDHLEVVS